MKKVKFLALLLVISMLVIVVLSGFSSPVKVRTFKLSHKSSDKNSWQLGSIKFAELVKERTNGEIIIEIYPNSQLGDQKEMTEAAQIGVIDFVLNAPATLSGFDTTNYSFNFYHLCTSIYYVFTEYDRLILKKGNILNENHCA